MPSVPKSLVCAQLGCKQARSKMNSYCIAHGGFNVDNSEERVLFKSMYSTGQWRRHRYTQLSLQPICQACIGRGVVTPAIVVDHVFPWNKIGKEYFYNNLFQSLCEPCHNTKTGLEQRGVIRHYTSPPHDFKLEDAKKILKT